MAATRYAMMMLKKAKTCDDARYKWRKIEYDNRAIVYPSVELLAGAVGDIQ